MITASALDVITQWGAPQVEAVLEDSGYTDNRLEMAQFEGINSKGAFVFRIITREDGEDQPTLGRVFLKYNFNSERFLAEF